MSTLPPIVAINLIPASLVQVADSPRLVGRVNGVSNKNSRVAAMAEDNSEPDTQELDELRSQLVGQAAEVRKLKDLIAERERAAYARGFEEGEARGHSRAVDDSEARQNVISQSASAAVETVEKALVRLDRLAAELAFAAVQQIVGNRQEIAERVGQVVRHQLSQLRKGLVVRVCVSTEDFPDPRVLLERIAAAGHEGVEINADAVLASGECRIQLQLGEIDAGIRQQLRALAGVLSIEDAHR